MTAIDEMRKALSNDPKYDENAVWYKIFGDQKAFNASVMSIKPQISNKWNIIQYQSYINKFVIPGIGSLDDWANPDAMYQKYKSRVVTTGGFGANSSDDPLEDMMAMINYVEFCNDITNVYNEVKDTLQEYGVSEIQSLVGSWTNCYWILKGFRREFYTSLYTMGNDESKHLYQQSPLRHMLVFLIDKRLARLIPDSDTFKFSSDYFSAMPYLKEVSSHVGAYLLEQYSADMYACKMIG